MGSSGGGDIAGLGFALGSQLSGKKPPPFPGVPTFFSKSTQKQLPFQLRFGSAGAGNADRILNAGIRSIEDLATNPGQLGPNVSTAIAPALGTENLRISRNTAGLQSQARGSLARSGQQGGPFATALAAAIGQAGASERGQARRDFLVQGEQLRREDINQSFFGFLDQVLAFINSGRGLQQQDLLGRQQRSLNERAAQTAQTAATLGSVSNINFGGGGNANTGVNNSNLSSSGFPLQA